jgi:signal transduction histidine kinase
MPYQQAGSASSLSWLRPRKLPRPAFLLDALLGVGLTIYLIAASAVAHDQWHLEVARNVLEGVAVGLRRVWTIPAMLAVLVTTGINELATWPYPLGIAIMLYTVALSRFPRWVAWTSAILSVFLLLLPWPSTIPMTTSLAIYLVPEMLLFTVAPVALGFYARERQKFVVTVQQREAGAARQANLEAERVRAAERNRLADEIHDVVAHSISLMIVHTGALKLAAPDERTREIAELVRSSGHVALQELREVVGVLRQDESAPLGPLIKLDNLPALIGESQAAGITVSFHQTGTPRKVTGAVERTAYRVVQESLTNVHKHAPGARAEVTLDWRPSRLDVTVRNDAPSGTPLHLPESGYGLRSLRERVSLLGGRFEAHPAGLGGWRVHASLPTGGPT